MKPLLCAIAATLLAVASASEIQAALVSQWDFTGPAPFAGFTLEGVPPTVEPDPFKPADKVVKLVLPRGGDRSEVKWVHQLVCPAEAWIGFRMLRYDSGQETFVCNMQVGPITPVGGKPIGLYQIQSVRSTGHWLFKKFNNPATGAARREPTSSYDLGAIRWGEWTAWVVHVRLAPDQTGRIEIWKDGVLVHSAAETNAVRGASVALKWGAYIGMGNHAGQSAEIYFDDIKVGDQTSSYVEVAPKP